MNFIKTLISAILMILTFTIFSTNSANAEVVNKIVAHVGNRVITEYDVQSLDPETYKKIIEIKEEAYRKQQIALYNKEAIEYLISQEVMAIAAEREGIRVQDEEVEAAIKEISRTNNIPEDKLEEYLAQEGMSLARYKYRLKNDILNARIRSQVLMPKIVVTEQDIREMAEEKKKDYDLYDKYDVKIILTPDKPSINKVTKAIKNGENFEEAAKKYSIDPSAAQGGKIGTLEPELLDDSMKNAIIGTKVGNITKPFELNGQWGIILVDGFKNKYDFDENTRKKLTDDAADKIFKQVFEVWLERNKSNTVIMREGQRFEIR